MTQAVNLRRFDLNLLVIFQSLMSAGSVAGAAEVVGLSPSAVSHALARLRVMFNDQLFRRTPKGLEPTERATELALEIGHGLEHIAKAIEFQHSFVPARSERSFTMQISDYVTGIILGPLARRLQHEAPRVSVNILPFAIGTDAREQRADVQVMFSPDRAAPGSLLTRRLLDDRFVVVMRPGHPAAAEDLTIGRYAALRHVRLSPAAIGTMQIDDALARRGMHRDLAMTVPSWIDLPPIIETTDLVAVVPRYWFLSDPRLKGLVSRELPISEVRFALDLRWEARSDHDPGQRWFRKVVCDIFDSLEPTT